MTLGWFMNNALIVIFVCLSISLLIIFKTCISKTRKLRISDVFYLGHVFILTLLLYAAYSIIYYNFIFHQRSLKFSQSLWNAEPERRVELVDDLIHSKMLDQTDSARVTSLLGTPMREFRNGANLRIGYYLGFPDKMLVIDPDFLIVEFEKGKVVKYYRKPGVPYIQ